MPVVEPIEVWCAYCGAMPPEPCTTKRGLRADAPHEARIERARAQSFAAGVSDGFKDAGEAARGAAEAMTAFARAYRGETDDNDR